MSDKTETIELDLIPVGQISPKNMLPSHNDFYIYDCKTENRDIELNNRGYLSIKGKIQRLDLNEKYKAFLKFAETHPIFGTSYWVENIYQDIPDTEEGQKEYLLSILTENQVKEIYKAYPDQDIIKLFTEDEFDHNIVRGFGETTYLLVKDKIISNLQYKELFSNLRKYGIGFNIIKKVIEEFGSPELAIQKIKENAYSLTKINGIGFKKADHVALSIVRTDLEERIAKEEITTQEASELYEAALRSEFRIKAGLAFLIEEEEGNGHTYINQNILIASCAEMLFIERELIHPQIISNYELFAEDDKVSLMSTYRCELGIAKYAHKMLNNSMDLNFDPDKFIERMEIKYKDVLFNGLSDQQKEFIHSIRKYNFQLLVGFAGTGKSFMQKLLKELLTQLGLTALWLTPTASAAKVLTNYLNDGTKAYTVQRGTRKATQTIVQRDEDGDEEEITGIFYDYIIVDEFSMVDVFLCHKLLSLLKNPHVRVLFVGDSFQNVAISCGNILQNMMDSNVIPSTILTEVFRQSEGGILDIATQIRMSQKFIDDDFVGTKMFGNNLLFHCMPYFKDKPSEFMDDSFESYYTSYLDNGYLPEEILALSPTKKSKLGTVTLNKRIQSIINPPSSMKKEMDMQKEKKEDEDKVIEVIKLRVGDYIVNTVNTYDIENIYEDLCDVVNGDTGIVKDIITDWKPTKVDPFDLPEVSMEDDVLGDDLIIKKEKNKNGVYIMFDDGEVKFDIPDRFKLLHAWCMTIHKAQGMGNKVVLLVFDKSHLFGMNANMLYVALTRAIDNCIVICQPKILNMVMKKFANLMRNTRLEEMLIEEKFRLEKEVS